MQKLPIHAVLPELSRALGDHSRAILQAPPGAGKTTIVPLHLLDTPWLAGRKILVLEPRRLAARAVCARMADILGERPGERVGYTMRLDTKIGPRTRIEVLTEGVLTQRILNDPEMKDTGLIIFDEFHERSLQADQGLTLSLEVQEALRNDLRILIMSATLDAASLTQVLGQDTPVITAAGQSYPVQTIYVPAPPAVPLERHACAVITTALQNETGSCLVFLPGAPEIHRLKRLLQQSNLPKNVCIHPLFGGLSREDQDKALHPAPPGRRKVVLATSIAETSLTIEGIRIVVDAGRTRLSRYSPRTGMDRLETIAVSQSSANQRRGRAGRLEPGICYRLWSETAQAALQAQTPPEIENTDLCDMLLTLADWGTTDPLRLTWVTQPPAAHLHQARSLLQELGALDSDGRITQHGHEIRRLGTHPRLAHLMVQAHKRDNAWTGCILAALLMERDIILHTPGASQNRDLRIRLDLLERYRTTRRIPDHVHHETCRRILQQAGIWARRLGADQGQIKPEASGMLLALAFPDRVAFQRPDTDGRTYILTNGKGARFLGSDPLTVFPWLVIPELDGKGKDATIFLAAPVDQHDLETDLSALWHTHEDYAWETARMEIVPTRTRFLGAISVSSRPIPKPDPQRLATALLNAVRERGIDLLPWEKTTRSWLARVRFLHAHGLDLPDFSTKTLLAELDDWLLPFIKTGKRGLKNIDLFQALKSRLTWEQAKLMDIHAPTHMTVPSGSHVSLDYAGDPPVLAVRIQEIFGWTTTPLLAKGRVPVCIHLLSPAQRPMQVTSDLAGFWKNGYPEIKKELKGRYPKHYWPDDPLTAQATRRTKKGMEKSQKHLSDGKK